MKLFLNCVVLSCVYAAAIIVVGGIAFTVVCSIVPAIEWAIGG